MNWLHYLLEANIYLGVFYLAYCLFLNKETYYLLNRIYLVFSCVIAFILPVLRLGILLPPLAPPPPMAPASFTAVEIANIPVAITPVVEQHFTLQNGLWYAYLAGTVIFFIILIVKLFSLFRLIGTKQLIKQNDYKLIYLDDSNGAFSFFNYLFIGSNTSQTNIIIRHELVHIRQKHSADIMFIELLKVINWFNPFIYLLQNSLKTVHEYIADEHTIDHESDAISYSTFLVNNAYGVSGPAITHSFFNYNLLKKRIIMLNQQRSGKLARLKYLLAVPIGAALLCASTLGFSKTYGWIDLIPQKPISVTDLALKEHGPIVTDEPIYGAFYKHLRNTLHFPTSLKNKPVNVYLLASFELDKKGLIKNVITDYRKYDSDISNSVIKAIESYNKPINDKLSGKRIMVIYFSAKGSPPPPPLDPKIGRDPGYLGSYMITDGSTAKLDIIKFPPPRVVPDKQVPEKKKTDVVKFPPPIVKPNNMPISASNFKAFADLRKFLSKTIRYPDAAREKNITEVITAKFEVDDNGKVINPVINETDINDFNDVVINALNAYNGTISEKKGAYTMMFAFLNTNNQIKFPPPVTASENFVGVVYLTVGKPKVDQVRFPPPIVKPNKSVPPKPKVDQVKFPPPVVKPDKAKSTSSNFEIDRTQIGDINALPKSTMVSKARLGTLNESVKKSITY